MTRIGCTTLPRERSASAVAMAGMSSSIRRSARTASSSRISGIPLMQRRSRATSSRPFRLAISSAVCPSPVRSRRSAPFSRSRRTSATSPLNAASWSGVWPLEGAAAVDRRAARDEEPHDGRAPIHPRARRRAALIGRLPSPFRETASTSAPASSSASTVAGWPKRPRDAAVSSRRGRAGGPPMDLRCSSRRTSASSPSAHASKKVGRAPRSRQTDEVRACRDRSRPGPVSRPCRPGRSRAPDWLTGFRRRPRRYRGGCDRAGQRSRSSPAG